MWVNKSFKIPMVTLLCSAMLITFAATCRADGGAVTSISLPGTQPTASGSTISGYGTQQVNQLPIKSSKSRKVSGTLPAQPGKGKIMTNIINIDNKFNGKTVTVKKGQKLALTLPSNPSTGYSWSYSASFNTKVIVQSGHDVSQPPPNIVGAAVNELWSYKAVGKGTANIALAYRRSWEKTAPAKIFKLKVVVIN